MNQPSALLPLFEDIGEVETIRHGIVFFSQIGVSARHLSNRTREEYERDLNDLDAFLGKHGITKLAQVRLKHLYGYLAELDTRGLRVGSRNRKANAIKTFFRFLHEQEILTRDIAERLIPPPLQQGEPRILTEDEYQRLLLACAHNPRDRAIIVLYLQTGMRLLELVRLKISDIQLPETIDSDEKHAGSVRITRSTGRTEHIPLNYKACEALIAYLKYRPNVPSPALFLNRYDESLSKRRIQYLVEEYLERIGISNASVRTLRHTMAAHHIAQGTDIQVIQETLGISLEATEKYVTLSKKTARKSLQENAL